MKQLFVSLMCLIGMNTIAQQNYVPSTVVTPQDDTLKGYIDFRNWSSSPAEIRFKASLDGKVTTYTPSQISEFRMYFNGETVYVTKHVLLDVTHRITTSINMAVETPTTELMDSTLFVQQLVNGNPGLYTFMDKYEQQHFMYGMPGGEPLELRYTRTMVAGEWGGKLYESKDYQQQLAELFKDNATVARQARKVEYHENRLIALFLAYNQQKSPGSDVGVTRRMKHPIYVGVTGGPSLNSYTWKGGSNNYLAGEYKSTVNFAAGVFADIPFNSAAMRKFSLYTEVLYKTLSTEGDVYAGRKAFFQFSYLQANLMGRYTYSKGLVKPFIDVGIGAAKILSTKKNDLYHPVAGTSMEAIDGPRTLEQMIIAGIGVKIGRLSLEARGMRSTGWVPYSNFSMPVRSFQLLAGIRIF